MRFATRHQSALHLLMATILLRVKATIDPTCEKLVKKSEFIRAFASVGSSLVLFTSSGKVFADIATDSFDEAKNTLKLAVAAKPIDEEYPTMKKKIVHKFYNVTLQFDNYKDFWFFVYQPTYGRAHLGVKIKYSKLVKLFKYDFQGDITVKTSHFSCNNSDDDCRDKVFPGLMVSSFKKTKWILVYPKTTKQMCVSMRIFDESAEANYSPQYDVLEDNVACRASFKPTVTAITNTKKKVYIFAKDGTIAVHEVLKESLYDDSIVNTQSELGAETKINMADFIKCIELDATKPTHKPSWNSLEFWLTNEGICILAIAAVVIVIVGFGIYAKARKPKAENNKNKKNTKRQKKGANKRQRRFSSVFSRLASVLAKKHKKKKRRRKRRTVASPAARRHSPFRGSPTVNTSLLSSQNSVTIDLEQHRRKQVKPVANVNAMASIIEKQRFARQNAVSNAVFYSARS